jgi:hypothetical protein
MRTLNFRILLVFSSLLAIAGAAAGQDGSRNPPGDRTDTGVRTWTEFTSAGNTRWGVVVAVDEKSVTVRWRSLNTDPEKDHEYFPIDLLAKGKIERNAEGSFGYRWSDMKKGDHVGVYVWKDREERRSSSTASASRDVRVGSCPKARTRRTTVGTSGTAC